MADILIMSSSATKKQIDNVIKKVKNLGFNVHISKGAEKTIIGIIGDTRGISDETFKILPGVAEVISILKEYKLASREFHPADTLIKVGNVEIGRNTLTIIAGPCSVESKAQLLKTAEFIKRCGGKILRGGAFKPRTSPYSFSGLGFEGL
ncbi:MAG: 3-deoxy-7-phosphoheptulonate synthase, partial [Candidatus Omnitrophica bacterium]|nr:3-deoxy-7-phosphoheptulonate synthase [Candidatus Omnitrophota bacterium]